MAFKFIAALAFVAVASAGFLPGAQVYHSGAVLHSAPLVHSTPILHSAQLLHAAPVLRTVAQPILTKTVEEYDPHPQYKYGYDVQDAITGDNKSQVESRDGDVVQGEYSLNDADGYRRTVQYTADPINGFNAVVRREPIVQAVAAPTFIKSAPIAYASAPVVYASHGTLHH